MSILQSQFQTISCDGPGCGKQELLEISDQLATAKKVAENPWIKNHRTVVAGGRRDPQGQPIQFNFCSDVCLVNAASAGLFVPDEEKRIVVPDGSATAQMHAAIEAKKREAAADAAIRSGAQIQISQK